MQPTSSRFAFLAPYLLTALAVAAPVLLKRFGVADDVQLAVCGIIALLAGGHATAQVIAKHKAGK